MAGIPNKDRGKARRRIMQEAEDFAAAHGFGALTVTALSGTAGMLPSQVRYHARNCAGLRFLVLDGLLLRVLNGLELPDDMPPGERLRGVCRAYAAARTGPLARHLGAVPWASLEPMQQQVLRYKQRLILQTFQEVVLDGCPDMAVDGSLVVARSVVAMLDAYADWFGEPGAPLPGAYADLACAMAQAVCAGSGQPREAAFCADAPAELALVATEAAARSAALQGPSTPL